MSHFDNYMDGAWVAGTQTQANINPSNTDDVIGHYASGTRADAAKAIAAAHAASFDWSLSTPQQRFDVLDFVGSEVLARKDELGELLSREEGKTRPEGIGEVARAGQIFKYFAGEALRQDGAKLDSVRPGVGVEITREALGVIGIITPWNFPIAIPAWKIAPALCYGNAVVFKPAELTPASAWALSEILSRSGLPKGVFNLVMGKGREVGAEILDNDLVDGVSFTGSVGTGQHVLKTCSARGAKVQLEMGGKNPLIICDDADLDVAVNCAVQGAFYSTGQRCTASSRLIVTQAIAERFIAKLTQATAALKVGDALEASTQIGPLADQSQLDKSLSYIEKSKAEGAKLVAGGTVVSANTPGFYLQPALFDHTTREMAINREEIFGPVASIIRVADYAAALDEANSTEFGLSAGICTTSLKTATHFKRHAKAGMVMVNLPTAGVDYHVPFGGRKSSSYGPREQGAYAREFYTVVKTAYQTA
ncbi:aldehyde dehydrogenase family protein [Woodsholea maritima]|uniref:aldehyde dehydrogenase family protein n=1 Tax=Woodsholea maritima TaxID=240237 RepID=UPI00037641A4|nr:aldehyde dehydrogenase family protein [Woodsholea maritima]